MLLSLSWVRLGWVGGVKRLIYLGLNNWHHGEVYCMFSIVHIVHMYCMGRLQCHGTFSDGTFSDGTFCTACSSLIMFLKLRHYLRIYIGSPLYQPIRTRGRQKVINISMLHLRYSLSRNKKCRHHCAFFSLFASGGAYPLCLEILQYIHTVTLPVLRIFHCEKCRIPTWEIMTMLIIGSVSVK